MSPLAALLAAAATALAALGEELERLYAEWEAAAGRARPDDVPNEMS